MAVSVGLAALVATALLAVPAVTRASWQNLSSPIINNPVIDSSGRVWAFSPHSYVCVLPGAASVTGTIRASDWTNIAPPIGYGAVALVVAPGDTIYVACEDQRGGPSSVFRRGVGAGAVWEELPVPTAYGMLRGLAVDDGGQVWLGGERGEVFRLEGRRWIKEVLPVPLHCDPIICAGRGLIWARAQARGDARIVVRRDGVWRTLLATQQRPTANLLYADEEAAILNVGTRLTRVWIDRPGVAEPWIDMKSAIIAVESRRSAWAFIGRRMVHAVDDSITDGGEVPFLPLYCCWCNGHLWVVAESGLWRYDDDDAPIDKPLNWSLNLIPEWIAEGSVPAQPVYGVGVLELMGRENIYLSRHTTIDVVVPTGSRERIAAWPALCASLGLEDNKATSRGDLAYKMGVALADLNADGREDVVLSTMYDGCRLLRNMHDQRLVSWTRQSGLGAMGGDNAEDIDLLDADGDGDLDAYVSILQGRDRLCLNDGAAHFTDVFTETGLVSPYGSTSALCRDLDGDGDTDIVVSSCGSGLFLSENLGATGGIPRFRTTVMMAPIANPDAPTGLSADNFTGVEAVDVDNDGLFDLVVGGRSQPTVFLWNRGGMRFERDDAVFADGPPQMKVAGVLALDPDADGDWDLALTGRGGTHFLENVEGRFRTPIGLPQQMLFCDNRYSTGSAVLDVDQDGDVDYTEGFLDEAPIVYRNTNPRRPLIVKVIGPQSNTSAVGARVDVLAAGTLRRVVAAQEIPGGSGYVSHSSKRLAFGGLDPGGRYDIRVRLPSGRQVLRRDYPGRGEIVIDMRVGPTARLAAVLTQWSAGLKDRWTAAFWLLVLAATGAVAAYAALQRRRLAIAYPWLGVVSIPILAWGLRRLLHLDPGAMPVVVATLGGLAGGLLGVGLAQPRPRTPTTTMLADFGRALRVFEHNQTPRKIVDRIMLVRSNAPARPEEWKAIVPLLREDVALFGVVVAPELAFVVEGARSAGMDHGEGARLLKQMRAVQRQLLAAGNEAWTRPQQLTRLDALIATTESFRKWTAHLRRQVDRRLATPLHPFMGEYAVSRMALHQVEIRLAVPAVTVRLPGPELAHVMDILLENAVRACAGRRVALTISGDAPQGGRVRLTVCDDGPGIAQDIRPRVFEAGVTGHAGGTGYGLYAARRTLEHFGGYIGLVDSATGACFEMELGMIIDPEG